MQSPVCPWFGSGCGAASAGHGGPGIPSGYVRFLGGELPAAALRASDSSSLLPLRLQKKHRASSIIPDPAKPLASHQLPSAPNLKRPSRPTGKFGGYQPVCRASRDHRSFVPKTSIPEGWRPRFSFPKPETRTAPSPDSRRDVPWRPSPGSHVSPTEARPPASPPTRGTTLCSSA